MWKKIESDSKLVSHLEGQISIIRAHSDQQQENTLLWHRRDINPYKSELRPFFQAITFLSSGEEVEPEMLGECDLPEAFQRALSFGRFIELCKGRIEQELTVPEILGLLSNFSSHEQIVELIKKRERISINERIWVSVIGTDLFWDWNKENLEFYFQEMYPPKAFASPQTETCDLCYETGVDPDTETVCAYCGGTGFIDDNDELTSLFETIIGLTGFSDSVNAHLENQEERDREV